MSDNLGVATLCEAFQRTAAIDPDGGGAAHPGRSRGDHLAASTPSGSAASPPGLAALGVGRGTRWR